MEASLKEHRGRVADIKINKGDTQAVSASYDGSCIIWDLKSHTRVMCLFESTMFKQVVYHPDEVSVIDNWLRQESHLLGLLRWSSYQNARWLRLQAKLTPSPSQRRVNISFQEVKTRKSSFGAMMKESVIMLVTDTLAVFQE